MANKKIHNKDDESYRVYYESTSSSDSIYSIISFQVFFLRNLEKDSIDRNGFSGKKNHHRFCCKA